MNQVFSDSENYQASFNYMETPLISSENYQPSLTSPYNSQNDDILTVSSPVQVTESSSSNDLNYDEQYSSTSQLIHQIHPSIFFYRPPNDAYHYYINCKEISYDTIECLL